MNQFLRFVEILKSLQTAGFFRNPPSPLPYPPLPKKKKEKGKENLIYRVLISHLSLLLPITQFNTKSFSNKLNIDYWSILKYIYLTIIWHFHSKMIKPHWIHVKCTLKWFNQKKLLLLTTSLKGISYERLFLAANFHWQTVNFCAF